jgi:catechol 2,3-dioxygenase-like lactoylglutathione lyase family enzyme
MTSVRHVGIVVSDMEKSLQFYRDLVGLQDAPVNEEMGPFLDGLSNTPGARIQTAKLAGGNSETSIELLCFENPSPSASAPLSSIGPTHVALNVSNLDDLYTRLSDAGVPFNAPPRVSPDGCAKVAFCQDPDGTFVELVELIK